jgi:hypothetical protein
MTSPPEAKGAVVRTRFGTASLAALAAVAGAPAAFGQAPAAHPVNPMPPARATLERPTPAVPTATIYATRGGLGGGPAGGRDQCERTSTYTDASWEGGSYILQQGFAQGEIAACSYVLTAADFPIQLRTAEMIFAQQVPAGVTTTTEWTVLVWQGLPNSGLLVAQESSDGTSLPHIVLTGTSGAHLVFQVDPADPEQIFIQDDGSHTFSIGFRIDRHNNPPPNPCTASPPAGSNAFPTTDTSGLASPTGNWLSALNCGALACPGGWLRFSQMISACRPTGDWVMRSTWESVNCAPASGACCLPGGTCQILTATGCAAQSGTYRGDNSDCSTANCPLPTGACCYANGFCLNQSSSDCAVGGGTYQGNGTTCGSGNTCPTGACCFPSGTCTAGLTATACTSQGGTFRGVGSTCANPCPQPQGACCTVTGGCLNLTQSDCAGIGGAWQGTGTTCATPGVCAQPSCYANCDNSTTPPVLNVLDFTCFLNRFTAGESYANCDNSTTPPVLNVLDFTCFLNKFTTGCP